mmetsp:Transcript_19410/g.42187  ORF Transcript_19410/g.42187 Transcript_19410/m.42187 type:complete len:457 (-) Transcript_19410:310-1680(-)
MASWLMVIVIFIDNNIFSLVQSFFPTVHNKVLIDYPKDSDPLSCYHPLCSHALLSQPESLFIRNMARRCVSKYLQYDVRIGNILILLLASLLTSSNFANAFHQPIAYSVTSTSASNIIHHHHRHSNNNNLYHSSTRIEAAAGAAAKDGGESTQIHFRAATSKDIPRCFEIESMSYPSDEAATLESLKNRQKYAGDYFLLCTTTSPSLDENEMIIGFVCATRCHEFTEESMSKLHDPEGRLLAIHSVVVDKNYRRRGVAKQMMERYVQDVIIKEEQVQQQKQHSDDATDADAAPAAIQSIVCIAKQHLLGFYAQCGFSVNRPSPIVHGKDLWYDLEIELATKMVTTKTIRTHPRPDESWYCKTEQFKPSLSFPEIKPHLDAHTKWVQSLRKSGDICIVSGYRVDAQGKPGGGGLMLFAAKSYEEAYELVLKDPLIANDCVDWELNGWIGQVGGIQVE